MRALHWTVATLFITLEGTPYTSVEVAPDEMKLQRVYVTAPPNSAPAQAESTDIRIWVEDTGSGTRDAGRGTRDPARCSSVASTSRARG